MNAPFGRTPGWTRLPVQLTLYDYTFSNLSHELTRTVRSSSKVSNPLFQPLIGSQEPPPLVLVPVINFDCPGKKRRFLTSVAGKIAKLAGGACGRRWLRQLRSQTQSLTAQEATFEGRGEREEISLRQCVLRAERNWLT